MTISWLINGAYGNYWWNVNETTVYVLVHVSSTAHPDIQHGDTLTYDVNVAYGGTSDLTGTVTLTYSTDEPTTSAVSGDMCGTPIHDVASELCSLRQIH